MDAATIYQILENKIIPLYYAKNSKGYSPEWIEYIKKSVTQITPRFTTKRMMDDYFEKFYNKLAKRHAMLEADNYKKAKELAAWKEDVASKWDKIEVIDAGYSEVVIQPNVGDTLGFQAVIDIKDIKDKNGIGVELVAIRTSLHNNDKLYGTKPLKLVKTEGSRLYFELPYQLNYAGSMKFAMRMYPQNELLPHRMDFAYVRWI